MHKEMNQVMLVSPIRNNPSAKAKVNTVWVPRCVRFYKSSATQASATLGDIVTALGSTVSGVAVNLRILGFKVWNVTGQSTSSNALRVTPLNGLSDSACATTGEDVGNSSNLPGLKVNIPDLLAKPNQGITAASTTAFAQLEGWLTGMAGTSPQNFLVEVQVLVQA